MKKSLGLLLGLCSAFVMAQMPSETQNEIAACNNGDNVACETAALKLAMQGGHGQEAGALYLQACEAGSGSACSSLGVMFEYGEDMPKDTAEAEKMYKKACDLGEESGCEGLGQAMMPTESLQEAQGVAEEADGVEGE